MYSDIHSIDEAIEMGAFDEVAPEPEPPPFVDDVPIPDPPDWIEQADDRGDTGPEPIKPAGSFPIDCLPVGYMRLVMELSAAFGVQREIPATALLAVIGGLLGRSAAIEAKPGWREHGNLWMAVVGPSGCGKSPVVAELLRPIQKKEALWFEKYKMERKAYDKTKKQGKDDEGDPPSRKQIIADDWTLESLATALDANPRGLLLYRDELAGMTGDIGKYRKSGGDGDKKRLLSAYDCGPWSVSRKTAGDLYIPAACLSVYGSIQPEILPSAFLRDDMTSGFASRFLFCWSVPLKPALWRYEGVTRWARDKIEATVELALKGFYLTDDQPFVVGLSLAAKDAFVSWFNELAAMPFLDFEAGERMGLLAKLKGQTLRLCLVLYALDFMDGDGVEHQPITEDQMRRAIRLARWFLPQSQKVWSALERKKIQSRNPLAVRVARAILDLRDKIEGGFLLLSLVVDCLNHGKPENLMVHPKTVTAALRKIGITTRHRSKGASIPMDIKTLTKLSGMFQ